MSQGEEYIDLYDTAAELGVSMATVWNLLKYHQIIRYKLPGQRRTVIRRADLETLRQPIPRGDRAGKEAA